MIEFYANNNRDKIISFPSYGKILMNGNSFAIEGDPIVVGIQFAKYIYEYFKKDTVMRTCIEIITDERHTVCIGEKLNVHCYFGHKLSFNLDWGGDKSEHFIEFKSAFDRYFSIPAFL